MHVWVMFVGFGIFGNIIIKIGWFLWSLRYSLDVVVLISSGWPLGSLSWWFKRLFTQIFLALFILVDESSSFALVDRNLGLGLSQVSLSLDSLIGFELKSLWEHLVDDGYLQLSCNKMSRVILLRFILLYLLQMVWLMGLNHFPSFFIYIYIYI